MLLPFAQSLQLWRHINGKYIENQCGVHAALADHD
jgi:hypothetical protein